MALASAHSPVTGTPPDDREPLPAGLKIAGYRIESVIGHGGFALTYKARAADNGTFVAIKEFMPLGIAVRDTGRTVRFSSADKASLFDWGLSSFLNEARTLARFNHRNLIRIITSGKGNGTAYIIMEFIDGEGFSTVMNNQLGRPGQEELRNFVVPLIQGLKQVHAAGIIHRDIKPDNILIRRSDNSPVLLDFGSARYAVGSKSRALTEIVSHGYSPFEQYQQASEQGPWTDIYALAAVMHHAITGQAPPPAPDRLNAHLNRSEDPLPALVEAGKGDYTETFLRAIDYGLNILEKDRPQTLEQWEEAFDPKSDSATKLKAVPRNISLLQERDPGRFRRRLLKAGGIAAAVLLTLGVAAYFLKPVIFPPKVVLYVQGSNTIGDALMPALSRAFLQTLGGTEPAVKQFGTDTEHLVHASMPRSLTPFAVEIRAYGSGTSAKGLAAGKDIGMSSRKILPEEVKSLLPLGDMLSPDSEHVVGLDGVSVIVNRENPSGYLTKGQVHDLFTGAITDWQQIAPPMKGPVHIYARDDKSGTYDTFVFLVLGKDKLDAGAKRYESSEHLSDDVAADLNGIGFIGLPYVRRAKALAISDGNSPALLPTRQTVGLEEYPLSRRLYLYTPQNPKNPYTSEFIKFALSERGQAIVDRVGFVTLNVDTALPDYDPKLPLDYLRATYGARRLSLNFRFADETGQKLDVRSVRDLVRVAHFFKDPANRDRKLVLIGYSERRGNAKQEQTASQDHIDTVTALLEKQQVPVAGRLAMGAQLPVASNDTEGGRARNRRVEVWIR